MLALLTTASTAGHYLTWGVLSVSLTNAVIIVLMVVIFLVALVVPLGRHQPGAPRHGKRP